MEQVARSIEQQLKIEDDPEQRALESLVAETQESPATPTETEETFVTNVEENDADAMLEREPSSIAICRKVLPALEPDDEDAACCSICLDDFTQEDPAISTTCG
jgi:hypothetical protein